MWQTPPAPLTQWERECERSLHESQQRRREPPPGMLPRRGREWLAVIAACVVIVSGLILARDAQGAEYNLQLRAAPAPGVHVVGRAHHHGRSHR
jgi:hypothetical protein